MGLLDQLWERYAAHVPYARTFVELSGGNFRNDHVAFRSLKGRGGIEPIVAFFERYGWARRDAYDFPDAHLDAVYLAKAGEPRVFVSQLRVEELSPRARRILDQLPTPGELTDLDSFSAPGILVREDELLELERDSQYGAWLLLFGREVNHFTASVDDVEQWQRRMRAAGIPMKDEIEGEPGAGLRQTATRAAPRRVRLREREREWPYAYLEIAERSGGFDGFVAAQARQLFEMTKR
jgi:2-oxoadipate dioxygenase/decarboxylase-like protein